MMIDDNLLDDDTKLALEKMAIPLKNRLIECQKHISDTLSVLQKIQDKMGV